MSFIVITESCGYSPIVNLSHECSLLYWMTLKPGNVLFETTKSRLRSILPSVFKLFEKNNNEIALIQNKFPIYTVKMINMF